MGFGMCLGDYYGEGDGDILKGLFGLWNLF